MFAQICFVLTLFRFITAIAQNGIANEVAGRVQALGVTLERAGIEEEIHTGDLFFLKESMTTARSASFVLAHRSRAEPAAKTILELSEFSFKPFKNIRSYLFSLESEKVGDAAGLCNEFAHSGTIGLRS